MEPKKGKNEGEPKFLISATINVSFVTRAHSFLSKS